MQVEKENQALEGAIAEAKIFSSRNDKIVSIEQKNMAQTLTERILNSIAGSEQEWKSAWGTVFKLGTPDQKAEFLLKVSDYLSDSDKKQIDAQILEDGSFRDSMAFCAKINWAKLPEHQSKVLDGTISPKMCAEFYRRVPAASYYDTQQAILRIKRQAEKMFLSTEDEKREDYRMTARIAVKALDDIENEMESSHVRMVRAGNELQKRLPIQKLRKNADAKL